MNARTVSSTLPKRLQWGNAAVDGLIAGAVAGVPMLGYLLLTSGAAPADLLNRFAANSMTLSPFLSLVGHLAVSAIYGMLFSLIWRTLRGGARRSMRVIGGLVYGLSLFAVAEWIILPALQSPLLGLPTVHWALAHVIYGIVLGLMNRSVR